MFLCEIVQGITSNVTSDTRAASTSVLAPVSIVELTDQNSLGDILVKELKLVFKK